MNSPTTLPGLLRSAAFLCLAPVAFAASSVAFPDTPEPSYADGKILAAMQLTVALKAQEFEQAGRMAEHVKTLEDFQETLAAEMAARLAHQADLSLLAVCPWLPAAERAQAQREMEDAVPELHSLSLRLATHLSFEASLLPKIAKKPSAETEARSGAYELLRNLQTALNVAALAQPEDYRARRAVADALRRAALADEAPEPAVTRARALPPAPPEITRFAATLTATRDHLQKLTTDTLALDAICTELINADPANADYWLQRGHVRFERGWRRGAIADLYVATALAPDAPGVAALRAVIIAAPELPASLWQEYVGEDAAIQVVAARTLSTLANLPPTPAAERHERGARAATRNRARRLYACSFIGDDAQRAAALAWVAAHHPLKRAFFPVLPEALGTQFGTDVQAAGNNALAVLKVHNRYAPLFAGTEGFWQRHVNLLAQVGQYPAALAALDSAAQLAPQAEWIASFRGQIQTRLAPAAK